MTSNLTRKTVLKLSKAFKAKGQKLPKVGWCKKIGDGEVCRDHKGYYWARRASGFDGVRGKGCKRIKRGKAAFTVCK